RRLGEGLDGDLRRRRVLARAARLRSGTRVSEAARPDLGLTRAGGCSLARAAGRCRAFKSCAYHRAALDPGGGVWAAPGPAGKIEGAGDRKLGSGVARMVARRIERSPEAARLDDARGPRGLGWCGRDRKGVEFDRGSRRFEWNRWCGGNRWRGNGDDRGWLQRSLRFNADLARRDFLRLRRLGLGPRQLEVYDLLPRRRHHGGGEHARREQVHDRERLLGSLLYKNQRQEDKNRRSQDVSRDRCGQGAEARLVLGQGTKQLLPDHAHKVMQLVVQTVDL